MGLLLRHISCSKDHIAFSAALSDFAGQAAAVMKEHNGQMVYSGGDDVMAYLPVHSCLNAADALRHCFADCMKSVIPTNSDIHPTLSIGIIIAHMLEPLEEVRQLALAAEKHAKQKRNALAIHVHKRSGGDSMRASYPFSNDPVQRMQQMAGWLRSDSPQCSAKFAYELRDMYRQYMNMPASQWLLDAEEAGRLIRSELERLAFKKKPEDASHESVRTWLDNELLPMYQPDEEPLEALRQLAEQMIITIQLEEAGHSHEATNTSTAT
ncbi:hypothetical protein D3C75_601140 [compost metagenome]